MANSGYNPRSIRPKTGARAHYYEGYMEKKDAKDKNFKKYWTGILGKTLYFYNNYKDVQEIEKLDLENFVSLIDESSSANQTEHRLLLKLKGMEVKLKVENLELRELWKGFILTVIQLRIPTNLILLPGHLCMLREALDKEEQRLNELMNSQYNRVNGDDKPSCFYRVSRMEAQALLESNPECGNLLVRPGTDETNFSISICYKYCGQPTTKHYKVKMTGKEYVLQVEPPRNFSSLTEIVDYFVTNTQNKLTPFEWDINYEERIILPQVDDESGESTLIFPSPPPVLPKKPNERVLPAIPTDPLPSDQDTYDLVDEDANEYMIPELSHRMSPLPEIPSRIPVKPKTPTNANVKPKTPTNVTVKPRTPTNMTVKPVPIAGNITQELSEKLRIQRMKLEEQ